MLNLLKNKNNVYKNKIKKSITSKDKNIVKFIDPKLNEFKHFPSSNRE